MFLVGLTGGIAAGKSTVAETWAKLGAYCIDADELAREVVRPGSNALAQIAERFGSIVLVSGELDRSKLADHIFSNPEARKDLEAIVHPAIQKLATELIAKAPDEAIVVYSIPLLVETNSKLPFDYVVTVEAPIDSQIQRLVENRHLSELQARQRIESQATPAQRAQVADVVLSSNQSIDALRADAQSLWRQIENLAEVK